MGERAQAVAPVKEMWKLFVAFFKIGLFTFGGGYAMLPMIQREIREKNNWCTEEEILDYYAIGQCTPGVIAVNCATFVGYKIKGVVGSLVSTCAVILPSLFIITIIAAGIQSFAEYAVVQHALAGIRVAVAVLVLKTVLQLIKKSVRSAFAAIVCLAALCLSLVCKISSVYIVVGSIVLGIVYGTVLKKEERK